MHLGNKASDNWAEVDYGPPNSGQKALVRDFQFPNFTFAFGFVNRVGKLAESAGHYPDVFFGHGHVKIWVSTFDSQEITREDHSLAHDIDALLG